MKKEEFLWVEKYRPNTVAECVIPERIKKSFQSYVSKKQIPNIILAGPPGTGKTTVALAMCKEIGLNHMFINSSRERGIDTLRTIIDSYASTVSLKGGHKVIILDEADGLTKDAQDALRGSIEQFSRNCTFILTCNHKLKLIEALHSRCPVVDFSLKPSEKPKMAAIFFKRMSEILDIEKVTYNKDALAAITTKFFPDYRRTLGELQKYASQGDIDAGVVAEINENLKLDDLVDSIVQQDFQAMRKWVANNSDFNQTRIYRNIYNSIMGKLPKHTIPEAIIILAKYQYQSAFVADQEINFVACMVELMALVK